MRAGQLVLNPPYFCAQITDFGAGSDAKFPLPGARTGGKDVPGIGHLGGWRCLRHESAAQTQRLSLASVGLEVEAASARGEQI